MKEKCCFNFIIKKENYIVYDAKKLENAVAGLIDKPNISADSVEIIILRYTAGKEVFSYNGNDIGDQKLIVQHEIEVLLKVKKADKLNDVFLIMASGGSDEELMHDVMDKMKKKIKDFCF